jgi:hypothetical protein
MKYEILKTLYESEITNEDKAVYSHKVASKSGSTPEEVEGLKDFVELKDDGYEFKRVWITQDGIDELKRLEAEIPVEDNTISADRVRLQELKAKIDTLTAEEKDEALELLVKVREI